MKYALNVCVNYPDDEKEINHPPMDMSQLAVTTAEYLADEAAGSFIFTVVPVIDTMGALGVKKD